MYFYSSLNSPFFWLNKLNVSRFQRKFLWLTHTRKQKCQSRKAFFLTSCVVAGQEFFLHLNFVFKRISLCFEIIFSQTLIGFYTSFSVSIKSVFGASGKQMSRWCWGFFNAISKKFRRGNVFRYKSTRQQP